MRACVCVCVCVYIAKGGYIIYIYIYIRIWTYIYKCVCVCVCVCVAVGVPTAMYSGVSSSPFLATTSTLTGFLPASEEERPADRSCHTLGVSKSICEKPGFGMRD
jgi:hypothetical protein